MGVLVTGSEGYVGRLLVSRLREVGESVVEWDIQRHEDEDIRDREGLAEVVPWSIVTDVIHLGAISGVEDCRRDPERAYETNVEGVENVADLCLSHNARLLFASSHAVHGRTVYGETKRRAVEFVERAREEGLDAVVLEMSNLYGEYSLDGETVSKGTVVDTFLEQANEGGPITVHKPGTQRRNFLHVEDAVAGYLSCLSGVEGNYSLMGPDSLSVLDLGVIVREAAGVPMSLVETDREEDPDYEPEAYRGDAPPGWTPERSIGAYVASRLS